MEGGGESRPDKAAPPARSATPATAGQRPLLIHRRYLCSSLSLRTEPGASIRARHSPRTERDGLAPNDRGGQRGYPAPPIGKQAREGGRGAHRPPAPPVGTARGPAPCPRLRPPFPPCGRRRRRRRWRRVPSAAARCCSCPGSASPPPAGEGALAGPRGAVGAG